MSTPDVNFRSIADVDGFTLYGERIDPATQGQAAGDFDDILKFSNARNGTARGMYVVGGRENAIDMNRGCQNIEIEDTILEGGDQAGVVVKGGSRNIKFRRVQFTKVRGWCEYLIGDWSDQSWEKTTGTVIADNDRADGKPVRVVVGRADWPAVVGGNVEILYFQSYCLKTYWWAKYLWTRFLLRHSTPIMHV